MNLNVPEALTVAVQAARHAAEIHLAHFGRVQEVRAKSTFSDLVTEVDGLAEAAIRSELNRHYPTHAVLGEEEGQSGAGEYRWVVDPLDGTVNYAHGYPVFCVSIALEYRQEALLGVVLDPTRDELFTATRGGGAFLNSKPLQVSGTPSLSTPALVSTGFPYDNSGEDNLRRVARLLRMGVPLRRPGAAALDLCNVACGRMDAYWEIGVNRWDVAAGALMVQEAGGIVTDAAGTPGPHGQMIVASNGKLHAELLGFLQE